MSPDRPFELHSCRQLFELYPASTSLRPAVEVIERTIQSEPGIAFTHCRGLLETVCVTILADRSIKILPNSKPNWLMTQVINTKIAWPIARALWSSETDPKRRTRR